MKNTHFLEAPASPISGLAHLDSLFSQQQENVCHLLILAKIK